MTDITWDPSDDELDEKWALFESGWDVLPPHRGLGLRHLVWLVVIIAAVLVPFYVAVGIG